MCIVCFAMLCACGSVGRAGGYVLTCVGIYRMPQRSMLSRCCCCCIHSRKWQISGARTALFALPVCLFPLDFFMLIPAPPIKLDEWTNFKERTQRRTFLWESASEEPFINI